MAKNKYFEIYQSITIAIQSGAYPPGSKLPSENTLREQYDVSRNTIRRAIDLLAQKGVVTPVHGKGVFVMSKPPLDFLVGGLQSFSEVSDLTACQFQTTIPLFEQITVDQSIAEQTGFAIGTQVYHLIRIRSIDQVKTILDENYFDCQLVPGLTPEISQQSIYAYIEKTLQLKISGAQKAINIQPASPTDQHYLHVSSNQLLAVIKNAVYFDSGQQFEYTESRHLPERFTFHTFARRT